jgi:uncharacterized protein (TIGR03437 family)
MRRLSEYIVEGYASGHRKNVAVILFLLVPIANAAPTSLQFLQTANAGVQGVVPMPSGSVLVFGSAQPYPCTVYSPPGCVQISPPLLAILNASGNQAAVLPFEALGSRDSTILSAAVDGSGNVWIAGTTDSDDFPLLHPLFSAKPAYGSIRFVAKLDPKLNILFSTYFAEPLGYLLAPLEIIVALDSSGNAYVAGTTADSAFPVTAPVFGTGGPDPGVLAFAFVAKIAADGSAVLYSRLLGGDGSGCQGVSSCTGYTFYTAPFAIAVDAGGNLTVAGTTLATNFPITANVYQTGGGAFVTRISADGSKMMWSTEIGIAPPPAHYPAVSSAQSIALDAVGNVYVAGSALAPIATTPGALQPTLQFTSVGTPAGEVTSIGFAAKLSSDGTQLLFATNLGGANGATLSGLTLDPTGNVWISGNTSSSNFPGLNNPSSADLDFVLELNADATALRQISALVPGTATLSPGFDSNGNLLLLGSAGNILRLDIPTVTSAPAIFALTNSAIPRAGATIAGGELATLYGVGLGSASGPAPAGGIVGEPDSNGIYPTELGGVSVVFAPNGTMAERAPLLYVGPNQINFQVPFLLAGQPMTVMTSTGGTVPLQPPGNGSIGIFGVLNQDGSINSALNPAQEGSIVVLYATGMGRPSATSPDGAISPSADSAFENLMEVTFQYFDGQSFGYSLPVLYAGTAPGLINGLDQVNVQLPFGVASPRLTITEGVYLAVSSNPVLVYTQ